MDGCAHSQCRSALTQFVGVVRLHSYLTHQHHIQGFVPHESLVMVLWQIH